MVSCPKNSLFDRHFGIQSFLCRMMTTHGVPFEREVGHPDSNQRPADILLKRWADGKDLAVDVTVHHPLGAGAVCTLDGTATSMREVATRKERLYHGLCRQNDWDFCPMVFDTWGGVHGPGLAVWKAVTHQVTTGLNPTSRGAVVAHLRRGLAVRLALSIA
jgi:hypothetical protein